MTSILNRCARSDRQGPPHHAGGSGLAEAQATRFPDSL